VFSSNATEGGRLQWRPGLVTACYRGPGVVGMAAAKVAGRLRSCGRAWAQPTSADGDSVCFHEMFDTRDTTETAKTSIFVLQ
jgi:hypothetical protein